MTNVKFDEEFCLRFPKLADSIFEKIDNQSLVNCQEASRGLEKVLKGQSQKLYLIRKIQNTVEAHDEYNGMWKTVVKDATTETIKHLELAVSKFYADIWSALCSTMNSIYRKVASTSPSRLEALLAFSDCL